VKVVDEDEEPGALKLDKLPGLKPAFKKDGSVTAANASSINDGAAAFVVMSAEKAAAQGIQVWAHVLMRWRGVFWYSKTARLPPLNACLAILFLSQFPEFFFSVIASVASFPSPPRYFCP
jgi:acetyl-CoA acetyltransferase